MRILFCSPNPLDPRLGAAKVLLEIADALTGIGWQCVVASDVDICPSIRGLSGLARLTTFTEALGDYVEKRSAEFDVVDYDHAYLPFPRQRFHPATLMVARSQLLVQHLGRIRIPTMNTWRSRLGRLLKGSYRQAILTREIAQADLTCKEADLVNVNNDDARLELVRRGIEEGKIIIVPIGLSRERLAQFPQDTEPPAEPRIAFVGTFDPRKGQREFPDIVRMITRELPAARFRMLGARYRTREEVLGHFPKPLRSHLEVIPSYAPEELPTLLAGCSMGIFPSHVEGFGIGVLEMLAASLPVIAYRAPGPPMMLPDAYLAPPGDFRTLSRMTVELLTSPDRLEAARRWARGRAQDFEWDDLARRTSHAYAEHLETLRRRG